MNLIWHRLTFTGVLQLAGSWSPGFLLEPRTALVALLPARVVLTLADELVRVVWIRLLTVGSVAVTHASAADRDVLDAVVVLKPAIRNTVMLT